MAQNLFELYKDDQQMVTALKTMIEASPITCFDKLKDKRAISTLNSTQRSFAENGNRFYDFIREVALYANEINHFINFKWLFTMTINHKTTYIYAGELFKELVLKKYGSL